MPERPKLIRIGDEMRRLCAVIDDDVGQWPDVTNRPMFGMTAYYRGGSIFAAVPRTRAAGSERSVLVKLPGARHGRLKRSIGPGAGWVAFELQSDADIGVALEWLAKAYEATKE